MNGLMPSQGGMPNMFNQYMPMYYPPMDPNMYMGMPSNQQGNFGLIIN